MSLVTSSANTKPSGVQHRQLDRRQRMALFEDVFQGFGDGQHRHASRIANETPTSYSHGKPAAQASGVAAIDRRGGAKQPVRRLTRNEWGHAESGQSFFPDFRGD